MSCIQALLVFNFVRKTPHIIVGSKLAQELCHVSPHLFPLFAFAVHDTNVKKKKNKNKSWDFTAAVVAKLRMFCIM